MRTPFSPFKLTKALLVSVIYTACNLVVAVPTDPPSAQRPSPKPPLTRAAATAPAPALVSSDRFADTMAERTRACTACHGAQGRAGPDGYYPRLAGKPAGYLHNQLRNFSQGRRHYDLMTRLIDPLTDDYLSEMAQYFSELQLPYPPPTAANSISADRLARGQQLVTQGDTSRGLPACTQCHGARLTGIQPNVPGLLGLPLDYLNAQLGAWQNGQRKANAPDCMAEVVRRISPGDLIAVSSWLARQPLPADTHPAPALKARTALSQTKPINQPTPQPTLPTPSAAEWRCGSAPDLAMSGDRP